MIAIIPARYASVRLPGKLLLEIAGKPLILHTLAAASKARSVNRVIVATDDVRIFDVVTSHGGEAVMTRGDHVSGSDRIAEVAETLPAGSIIVNVQGDEPLISPETIDRAVEALVNDSSTDIVTTYEMIMNDEDARNSDVVKVVCSVDGYALYFSRSAIPFARDEKAFAGFRKHTGLYVYRREYLLKFTRWAQSSLEKIEMLEQLRALENGARIRVVEAAGQSIGVDTLEDLEKVRRVLEPGRAHSQI